MCLGIPGQVVEIVDLSEQTILAEVEGVRREVSSALLGIRDGDDVVAVGTASGDEAVGVGDWILIHVGFAMSKIDEDEAAETLKALKMFSGDFEQEIAEFAGADEDWDPFAAVGFVTPQAALAGEHSAEEHAAPRAAPATPRAAPATPRATPAPGGDDR